MDHPKDHSLFGLGLPGYIEGMTILPSCLERELLLMEEIRRSPVEVGS